MKKVFTLLFVIVAFSVSYLIYDELYFDPLSKVDFAKLFPGYNGKKDIICKEDFLGIATRGKFFELYVYSVDNVEIGNDYPHLFNLEKSKVSKETIVGKWRRCPVNEDVRKLFNFTLESKNLNSICCPYSVNNLMLNPRNFFSYLSVSESEQYFFLFSSEKNTLYYLRRRGL